MKLHVQTFLILDSLRENNFETEVGPGVYDIHSPRVPSVDEIVNALNIMLTKSAGTNSGLIQTAA